MDIELLAPAGSYEAMKAAVCAGADAVYIGGDKFGARAFADNLDRDQMVQAIDEMHIHGKRLYLTVNTLLKNRELEKELYQYLAPFYEAGLDAVIVQDLGVLKFVRDEFPGLPIHASTQMTVTGAESASLLKEAGAARVVTARELSLQEIKAIYDATHMEIESFVHGALCYCYSGQCLMSSLIGGRSGNRGRCAQPCRLPYQVWKDGRKYNDDKTAYPLSPKDMCTVRILPEILKAGVRSLKIEGRMKKPEYTAGVVEIYRKYLDLYLDSGESPQVTSQDYQTLLDIYNRDGFHESYYYMRNGRSMMALRNEKKGVRGEELRNPRNEALFSRIRKNYLEEKKQEKIKGSLNLFPGCPAILEVSMGVYHAAVQGETVQEAQSRPLEEGRVRQQIEKTGGTDFVFESLDIFMGESVFLPLQKLNELRRSALKALKEEILSGRRRTLEGACGKRVKSCARHLGGGKSEAPELFASVQTKDQLEAVLGIAEISRIYADSGIFSKENFLEEAGFYIRSAQACKKQAFLTLPHIVRDKELTGRSEYFGELVKRGLEGFLVRNLESFGVLKKSGLSHLAVLDTNLYTMNDWSLDFWDELGVMQDTIPLELNKKELYHRKNENSEILVYGYIPMMISVQCLQKNLGECGHKCAVFTLKDRYQKEFHAICNCEFCYNTIYNTVPLSLFREAEEIKKLGVQKLRLSFSIESKTETKQTAREFVKVFLQGKEPGQFLLQMETTKGHFGRGVE